LVYFFKGGYKWVNELNQDEPLFEQFKRVKSKLTPENLCTGSAATLLPFVKEIFAYDFKEEPNYGKLKKMLTCVLLDKDIAPSLHFDWSRFPKALLIA
jgi:hypothetical protein